MSQANQEWTYIHDHAKRHPFFGEVKHRLSPSGEREVELVVMPDPKFGFELKMAALAIDGSRSMMQPFAAHLPLLARKKRNTVHPTAQDIALHLAENAGGECHLAYWACGGDGGDVEPVDRMTTERLKTYEFVGPQNWGGGTKLTPIVRYFWENVFDSSDGIGLAVILTDGAWDDDDHRQLLELTQQMCEDVSAGRRKLMKVVILGLKTDSNASEIEKIEHHFESLDNFDSGTGIDVWFHKWVHEMAANSEIFIELVKDWSLGLGGKVIDGAGREVLVCETFNFGVKFALPASSREFTLALDDVGDIQQPLA